MKFWFQILVGFLIILNLFSLYFFGEEIGRWFRFGTMLLFVFLYYFKFHFTWKLFIALLLLLICDFCLVFYELEDLKIIIYLTRISAYFVLVWIVSPYIRKLKLGFFSGVIGVFTLGINIYLMSVMVDSVPEAMASGLFYPLFFLFGFSLLALATASISFHNRFATRQSFFFVVASLSLIFSDISFYIATYLDFEVFHYIDRFWNVLGVAGLLAFSSSKISGSAHTNIA